MSVTFLTTEDKQVIEQNISQLSEEIEKLQGNEAVDVSKIVKVLPIEVLPGDSTTRIALEFTQGAIHTETGAEVNSGARIRSEYIPLGEGYVVQLTEEHVADRTFWIRVFDINKTYLGTVDRDSNGNLQIGPYATPIPLAVDDVQQVFPTASYVRVVVKSEPDGTNLTPQDGVCMYMTQPGGGAKSLDDIYIRHGVGKYSPSDITFMFDVGDYNTRGYLKLPPNYDRFGEAVPLIVFVHGSGDFTNIDSASMTSLYDEYYNYLRDCGYAVFDCYGWTSKYPNGSSHTWGVPINMEAYKKGIKHVLKTYNLDGDNIFVSCKSLGGIVAAALALDGTIKIRACGMLAPLLDPLSTGKLGYSRENRVRLAAEWGFEGDWQSVLDVENDDYDAAAAKAYIATQADKIAGWNPMWKNMPLPLATKVDNSLNYKNDDTAYRYCDTPVKIWIAPDDASELYNLSANFVRTLKNGGCIAELRIMPEGTGGHHAVDNDPAALKKASVTTALGVTHTNVPTAYYELSQWFDRFRV